MIGSMHQKRVLIYWENGENRGNYYYSQINVSMEIFFLQLTWFPLFSHISQYVSTLFANSESDIHGKFARGDIHGGSDRCIQAVD